MLEEFILNLQMREINAWKQGKEICLELLKEMEEKQVPTIK